MNDLIQDIKTARHPVSLHVSYAGDNDSFEAPTDGLLSALFSRASFTVAFTSNFKNLLTYLLKKAKEYTSVVTDCFSFPLTSSSTMLFFLYCSRMCGSLAEGVLAVVASTLLLKSMSTGCGRPSLVSKTTLLLFKSLWIYPHRKIYKHTYSRKLRNTRLRSQMVFPSHQQVHAQCYCSYTVCECVEV